MFNILVYNEGLWLVNDIVRVNHADRHNNNYQDSLQRIHCSQQPTLISL